MDLNALMSQHWPLVTAAIVAGLYWRDFAAGIGPAFAAVATRVRTTLSGLRVPMIGARSNPKTTRDEAIAGLLAVADYGAEVNCATIVEAARTAAADVVSHVHIEPQPPVPAPETVA